MASFKSIPPFWHSLASPVAGSPLLASPASKLNDFGAGSSLELQFGRLMDDPQTYRPALFSTKSCRA